MLSLLESFLILTNTTLAKSTLKKWIGKIHLWIGLITGLVVFLVSISGSIYVFKDELFNLIHQDIVYNTSTNLEQKSFSEINDIALKELGEDCRFKYIATYKNLNKNWVFHTRKFNKEGFTYFDKIVYKKTAYINPYTGDVAGVIDNEIAFFDLVMAFHWGLLLGSVGEQIVRWSVLLFVVSLISGLIIWWPKKWKALKNAIKIRFSARWRRINYDSHRVSGFYMFPIALIIAVTGLVWGFDWVSDLVYTSAQLSTAKPEKEVFESFKKLAQVCFRVFLFKNQ